MIETRLSLFDNLVSLNGRIDLLMAQVEQKERMKENMERMIPQVKIVVLLVGYFIQAFSDDCRSAYI